MKFFVFICAFTLMVQAYTFSFAENGTLTLQEAIRIALENNPNYSQTLNQEKASDARVTQAKSFYLPSVSLQASGGYSNVDTPLIEEETTDSQNIAVTMTQRLFDGFESSNLIDEQKALNTSSERQVENVQETLGVEVAFNYINILRFKDFMEKVNENVKVHYDIYEKIKRNVDAGALTKADLYQVEARLSRAKSTRENIRRDLIDAQATFKRLAGFDAQGVLEKPELAASILTEDLNTFIDDSVQNNPNIKSLMADRDASKFSMDASSGKYYPTVDLQLQRSQGKNLNGIEGSEKRDSALITMNWDLYTGGSDTARVKEKTYQYYEAQDRLEAGVRALENDIRSTWATRVSAGYRAEELLAQIDANGKVVQAYQDQFKLSRRTLIDVLDAQNELFVSKINYVDAVYSALFSSLRLLQFRGSLLHDIGVYDANRSGE